MLQGVRVVELATMVAAPSAPCLLADWGAFDLHHQGKRSIAHHRPRRPRGDSCGW